jgi:hypothetical protein
VNVDSSDFKDCSEPAKIMIKKSKNRRGFIKRFNTLNIEGASAKKEIIFIGFF